MIELEKTYLIKKLPENLENCKFKEIIDLYLPESSEHSKIRLRRNGDRYELTKKEPVNGTDSSCQEEQTIILTEIEFNTFNQLKGQKVHKLRYYYNYNGRVAEIDVFQDLLKGLVLVDFEFKTIEEKDSFKMPEYCLADVTQDVFTAGGVICGKCYNDIEGELKKYNYNKIN